MGLALRHAGCSARETRLQLVRGGLALNRRRKGRTVGHLRAGEMVCGTSGVEEYFKRLD
jgi:hypothetical protein